MAPRYNIDHATNDDYPFMTCVVKVSSRSSYGGNGRKTVAKVLDKCQGVHSCRMDGNGLVEISGTVDPSVLLKTLGGAGRSAELCWFQFGECSNNLFMPSTADGRYLQAPNVSRPKLPSHQPITSHGHSYGYDQYGNTGYSSYGNQIGYYGGEQKQHDYHHAHASAPVHGYPQSGYGYEENQTSLRRRSSAPDDICCTIM